MRDEIFKKLAEHLDQLPGGFSPSSTGADIRLLIEAHRNIAKRLGIVEPSIRMDSQAKYGIVARGEASIYLRLPSPKTPAYNEKVWDHAAGAILIEEAGGKITDVMGKTLDFGVGYELTRNTGVIATNGRLHEEVLSAL
jgi:3'(2'), 5'-bisphosphate nucleotidase